MNPSLSIEAPTSLAETGEKKITDLPTKVFITSAYDDPKPIVFFREYARLDRFKNHITVDGADEADIIFFIENSRYTSDYFFSKLKRHPLVKKYPEKVFMYNPHDMPWFVLRGLYTCMPKQRFDSKYIAASPYVEVINTYVECDFTISPKYLYSFFGAPSSAARRKIFDMTHHSRGIVMDSPANIFFSDNMYKPKTPQLQYAALLTNSKFVLAPQGIGPSSIRLFEIMKAGRVPVIISDNFTYPKGPDWDRISITLPEDHVQNIPQLLEKEEHTWLEKARLARKAWEDYFAPDSVFNYFVNTALELKKNDVRLTFEFMYRQTIADGKYRFRKLIIQNVKVLITFLKRNNLVESSYI